MTMHYFSTKNRQQPYTFREAVLKGLPEDNGLFMPESIPQLSSAFSSALDQLSLDQIGFEVLRHFTGEDIPETYLEKLTEETFNFPIPLVAVEAGIRALELFHGPTLAFKDVGARCLARCISYFSKDQDRKTVVLVATSGDTGSAVAHGFYRVENTDVVILYPKGKVSALQESQFTTLGANIHAVEIDGTFDDCQRLVKKAFLDKDLGKDVRLTSANSINIARLLPQSVYYFWAYAQLENKDLPVYISVPSGNFGNLTAGVLARKMGLPISRFIAATNINDTFPRYMHSGQYEARPSIATLSNAMDVGDPSNFARLVHFYGNAQVMEQDLSSYSFTDAETKTIVKEVYDGTGYLMDPHGAVGYLGLTRELRSARHESNLRAREGLANGIFLETAHPAKFRDSVEAIISETVSLPQALAESQHKEKKSIPLENDFEALKEVVLSTAEV